LDISHLFPLLNVLESEFIENIVKQHVASPSDHVLQKFLAHYLTSLVHDEESADQVVLLSKALFSKDESIELESIEIEKLLDSSRLRKFKSSDFQSSSLSAIEFFRVIFPEWSRSYIKNMINTGSVKLNRQKILDISTEIKIDELPKNTISNFGKTSFYIISIKKEKQI
jgi:tyrosyl-tRNA synthetase